jgi:beta-phosphoglucomutase
MPEFEAIFFDFDGVLLDTEPVHWSCWAQVLAPAGLTLTWEYYRDSCIGIDDRDMLRNMAGQANPPREWDSLWALYPGKQTLFQARMAQPQFDPALVQLLARLDGPYRLAVVSSSSTMEIEPLLIAGGIRRHFGAIVGGESVKRHKPFPEPYLLAAERLGVRTALVLEDSAAGIASGRAAGFEVIPVKHPNQVSELVLQRLSGRPALEMSR